MSGVMCLPSIISAIKPHKEKVSSNDPYTRQYKDCHLLIFCHF